MMVTMSTSQQPLLSVIVAVLAWVGLALVYSILLSTDLGETLVQSVHNTIVASDSKAAAMALYAVLIAFSLLLPMSPATALVILGVALWGPALTFTLSFMAALAAAVISYVTGRSLRRLPSLRLQHALGRLEDLIGQIKAVWMVIFLLRAIPNPAYDVWGYAAGAMGVRFPTYISATALGGAIPLGLLCWFA